LLVASPLRVGLAYAQEPPRQEQPPPPPAAAAPQPAPPAATDVQAAISRAGGSLPVDLPPIEGVGVRPDIEVDLCSAFCGGRDAPLEKALTLAASGRR